MKGRITIEFLDDGTIDVNIEKVHYVQQYGVAAMLHEMARQQHALDSAMKQGQGLEVVRGMPGS